MSNQNLRSAVRESDLVDRLRAASLNPDEMRRGWLAEAIDEITKLQKEAARYRFLEKCAPSTLMRIACLNTGHVSRGYACPEAVLKATTAADAIDAAIAAASHSVKTADPLL